MALEIAKSFTIQAPIAAVWSFPPPLPRRSSQHRQPAPASALSEAATFKPSPPAEVLDLGAVGSKAAVNVLMSTLTGPALCSSVNQLLPISTTPQASR